MGRFSSFISVRGHRSSLFAAKGPCVYSRGEWGYILILRSNGESRKVFRPKGMNHICPQGIEQVSPVRLLKTLFKVYLYIFQVISLALVFSMIIIYTYRNEFPG